MDNLSPKSWNQKTKPHLLCPGCGHAIALKQLGFAIDEMNNQKDIALGIDIGCSLLVWNFFNVDTIQTHHGRTTPVMVGYKIAKPKRIALAYMGDGGGYAIGLQSLIHAAFRNNPITVILINNENYAMTGGQMSPTTETGVKTATSPNGKDIKFGPGFKGPELLRGIANANAFIARGSVSNPIQLKTLLIKALKNQTENNAFSFIEVLSVCPTNWKTDAQASFDKLKEMEKYYPIGEILK